MAAIAIVSTGVATWLSLVTPGGIRDQGASGLISTWIGVIVLGVLGVRVVQRRARQPIGWIMLAMAAAGGLTTLAEVYAFVTLVTGAYALPGGTVADAAGTASWLLAFAGLTWIVLLFPDGKVPSPRWQPLTWLTAITFAGAWLGATFQPGVQNPPFDHLVNPVGVTWLGGTGQIAVGFFMIGMLLCVVATAASAVIRFRRSRGAERAQMKWLAFSGGLVPLALGGCFLGQLLTGSVSYGNYLFQFAITSVPLAVGTAILRYRLYDIDRLISRTLVYASLTIMLIAGFAATSAVVGVVLGRGSDWTTAVATAVTVLAFRPLRTRVQTAVDRRFDRARYEGLHAVDQFLEDLRGDRDSPERIEAVLGAALHDPTLELRLWLPAHQGYVDCRGRPVPPPGTADDRAVTSIERGGARLAVAIHDLRLRDRPDVLAAVLDHARLALEVARLQAEVSAHLADVAESRARIVEASYEERRRLERDLHDGAQQRLVCLGLSIRRLQRSLPEEARILEPALDRAVGEIGETISDLRRLAAGIRPARLDDGLAAALGDLVRILPLPVVVTASPERAPAAVEAAAYFFACEAITNAVKHAAASQITVQTIQDGGKLVVAVFDDGIGGAVARPGSGLAGLADRVAGHGGQVMLESPASGGTLLRAVIPCES
jgi:signal transduction histidine kinase